MPCAWRVGYLRLNAASFQGLLVPTPEVLSRVDEVGEPAAELSRRRDL